MFCTRIALAAAFVFALTAAFCTQMANGEEKKADISKDKLVAVWEATKGDTKGSLPKGSTITFTKDGKIHLEVKAAQVVKVDGTYTINGDKLLVVLMDQGKEHKETITVTKLTDTELITKDEANVIDEFKKVVK